MKKDNSKSKFKYFARGAGIAKMGPYNSDIEAWDALRGHDGMPVSGATVWPEQILDHITEASIPYALKRDYKNNPTVKASIQTAINAQMNLEEALIFTIQNLIKSDEATKAEFKKKLESHVPIFVLKEAKDAR